MALGDTFYNNNGFGSTGFGSGNYGFGNFNTPNITNTLLPQNTGGSLGIFNNTGGFKKAFTPDPSIGLGQPSGMAGADGGIKSFLSNPITQMGIGGLVGAYTAFNQAEQERDATRKRNAQIKTAISGLQNTQTDMINRTQGNTNTLLNQYAMSNDDRKAMGYSSMYGGQVEGMNRGIDEFQKNIANLKTQIQNVPSRGSLWANAFTGALGGVFGVGNLKNQADQSKYYQSQYNQYYGS